MADGPSRSFFDLWSLSYDNPVLQAVVYRPVQDQVIAALRVQAPQRVLDVGGGTGHLASRLSEVAGRHVIGLDYSRGMLSRAVRRSTVPSWVQGDAMTLPFADASVDAIVCTESFHWYPDQSRALHEFGRVVRPGGRIYIAVVTSPHERFSDQILRVSARYGQPFYWPTAAELRSMLAEAGLHVRSQRRVWRLPAGLLFAPALTVAERAAVASGAVRGT